MQEGGEDEGGGVFSEIMGWCERGGAEAKVKGTVLLWTHAKKTLGFKKL